MKKSKSPPPVDESTPASAASVAGANRQWARIAIAVLGIGLLGGGGALLLHRNPDLEAARQRVPREMVNDSNSAVPPSGAAADQGKPATPPAATPAYEPKPQDRIITKEQKTKFVDTLRRGPHGKIAVCAFQGDREAYLYAAQLAAMFREADFTIGDPPVNFLPEGEAPQNPPVVFFVSNRVPMRPYALALKDALDLIGIHSDFSYREKPDHPDDLQIGVYPKP